MFLVRRLFTGVANRRSVASLSVALVLAFGLAPAGASATEELNLDLGEGLSISVTGVDWNDSREVEQFLLRVQATQGSDSIDWLSLHSTPLVIRDAVLATLTGPAEYQVVHEETRPASRIETTRMLSELFGSAAKAAEAQGWSCGWAYMKVRYWTGFITLYWFSLTTSFCWNGTNVQAIPAQAVAGDGSWGWSYLGCVACYVTGWPAPTAYRSFAMGRMNFGVGVDIDRFPWIQHIVYGRGYR